MINFRRLALVSGIAVLSAVAFTPKAQAQSTDVDFTGNVPATCTINSVTNGTLAASDPTFYTAYAGIGTEGTINITCNAGTTFTVASITDNGSSSGVFATLDDVDAGIVSPGGTLVASAQITPSGTRYRTVIFTPINTPGSVISGPITNQTYRVATNIAKAGGLKVGTYKIRQNIVLTPQ